jgi:formylglycine-generating enzyme required for sulfatase activity
MGSTRAQLNALVSQYASLQLAWLLNEEPQHQVCLDGFWIDPYEVTNALYAGWGDQRPRANVTWTEARNFCTGRGMRLPTEAEWEYAARGSNSMIYPWGNEFASSNAVYVNNSGNQTALVGSYPSGQSWVGAYDMGGNVKEWTSSLFWSYPYVSTDGRENPNTSGDRVVRGGAFYDQPYILRGAGRNWTAAATADWAVGFRCAMDAN